MKEGEEKRRWKEGTKNEHEEVCGRRKLKEGLGGGRRKGVGAGGREKMWRKWKMKGDNDAT